jgi:hypothetical protein
MVLNPGDPIIRKANAERGCVTDFPPEDRGLLTAQLGHYSRVQSVNSEDTVTWSAFGAQSLDPWLPMMLASKLGLDDIPRTWSARFWERQPHPDTGLTIHGPESEITLSTPGWCIEIESKWRSDLDGHQGSARTRSQLEMRSHTARRNASNGQSAVLIVAPGPSLYPPARKATSVFRKYFDVDGDEYMPQACARELDAHIVTWESLAEILEQQTGYEHVGSYLRWRLDLLR